MKPLLSVCIPIYNRLPFLERQLDRMMDDKELFKEQVQLIISDNCSSEDLKSCCEKYQSQGLQLLYHCNETNIGPDGNFAWCFHHADGKYVWLLGSDDILVKGVLEKIVSLLQDENYGLVALSMKPKNEEVTTYYDHGEILADICYWITFMSVNIIRTETIKTIALSDFLSSFMIQVPAYLNACLASDVNVVLYLGYPFEKDSNAENNGGYNLFQVFIENLHGIYQSFVDKEMLSQKTFERIKRIEYKDFLVGFIVDFLIFRLPKRKNFDLDNSWGILWKHYGRYFYSYYYLARRIAVRIVRLLLRK